MFVCIYVQRHVRGETRMGDGDMGVGEMTVNRRGLSNGGNCKSATT